MDNSQLSTVPNLLRSSRAHWDYCPYPLITFSETANDCTHRSYARMHQYADCKRIFGLLRSKNLRRYVSILKGLRVTELQSEEKKYIV